MGYITKLSDEIGFSTLVTSGSDVYIITFLRMLRFYGFTGISLVLALFLKEDGYNERYIGLLMSLMFFGDLVTSFLLSLVADKVGRKATYVLSSLVMAITGVCFIYFHQNYIVIFLVSFIGIITPHGGEVGPFRSVEESVIADLCAYEKRSDIYAWGSFLSNLASAFGSVTIGSLITYAQKEYGYSKIDSYLIIFWVYIVISLLMAVLSLFLTHKVELNYHQISNGATSTTDAQVNVAASGETAPLLAASAVVQPQQRKSFWSKFVPNLSGESASAIVIKLTLLFALDAFASSIISFSWQSYYISRKFNISTEDLGGVFFCTMIITSITALLSTSFSKRLGPVVTMVSTHLPSSIALALVPAPSSLKVTIVILIIRAMTQQMDVAPKKVFLTTVIKPSQRTAILGWVNVVKTLAQLAGPSITGVLTSFDLQWVCFVVAGTLKSVYDLGIWASFLEYNRHNVH
ncbi:hypothetical protein WICANDRAFT_105032 [Wickerhamomyces anomalus NRRL Y-366-8]|uniref:Major facilitator superfamily (MFS) profile domain-containing protein n=1 Tax=Wickerhamomyces anomalus (strain ATCC 58044 / CBS 1984 / NCYC 433 / NRRL Y-366-8) TaxID=683960 RepID=A0A1E3P540_WICAA|nr:uncharacterized protein WICANDRAFT_105032 [Wickerhamomyces anomalus NRRL Y-366-8]ODQ60012.1 hypothetical protein WICANDRAFT_105032 [Wickerhamomyces anomalus NRRL Y-366-8]